MQSNAARAGLLVALAAVAVVLFIVLSGDDDGDSGSETTESAQTATAPDTPTVSTAPLTIVIEGGEPVGGVAELEATKGDRVRFVVRSDVADEVHVHGYDISKEVEAGGQVAFDFPANIDGAFEVELEGSATEIAELTVQPG